MTQEEKELLLKDLCARSPYRVKVQIDFGEHCIKYGIDRYVDDTVICVLPETFEVGVNDEDQACDIEDVKPYLRSMSSMTEDEIEEFSYRVFQQPDLNMVKEWNTLILIIDSNQLSKAVDFLNKRMFDWRKIKRDNKYISMIEAGIALEAPKDMYNTKTE